MVADKDDLILRLYEALADLSLGVDEVRLSFMNEPVALRELGAVARSARPLLDDACIHLMEAGYAWDGRKFVPVSIAG